jgi:exopolyphosphatase/guanosine-5'-triphosphate,3'-diphosphate pyrophosphatase
METNKHIAIIDIRSNSIRLRLSLNEEVILRKNITTQLSRDMLNGLLNAQSIQRTLVGLCELVGDCVMVNAQIHVFATAAVRNAKNGNEFRSLFNEIFGISIDVLSGEEEAEMGILRALGGEDGCVIDVGGASSELVISNNKKIIYAHSIPLGAVVLTDRCARDLDKGRALIGEYLKRLPSPPVKIEQAYAIGGTASNIAFIHSGIKVFNRDLTNGVKASRAQVDLTTHNFYSLSPAEICEKYNLKPLRSNVIHSGALILSELLAYINAKEVCFTENDNLEGYYLAKIMGKRYEK